MLSQQDTTLPLTQEALLHRIANRIRQSLELETILSTTAAEVRAYLGTDRVKIYQFRPDEHGVVVAESLQGDRLPSLLGLHFPQTTFLVMPVNCLYVRGSVRSLILVAMRLVLARLTVPKPEKRSPQLMFGTVPLIRATAST
jgi:light-regulated signal transduction histidine kinase (bacteriophytochrome)